MSDLPEQERPRTALVLDDEAHIGAIVCKVLQMTGITARQFTEPMPFLAEVKRSQPQLIVVDLALGQSDAIEVIRKLEVLKFPGLVLLISGRDEATLAEIERIGRSRGLRMLPSLRKPFRAAELKAALEAPAKFDAPAPQQPDAPPRPRTQNVNLREALQQHWLEVWYQPKVNLQSQTICGAEALIRARHPEHGIIAPVDLLPPASDPLYRPLSLFVVQRAIADWKTFCDAGHSLKLAVNMPASVLNAPGFVDAVRNLIPTGSDFPGLIVEVTEDEIIRDPNWIHEVAMQLQLCNVTLSIDDFGSAYASLSRLKDMPFREVKLDRSFVSGCASDALKRGLCQTVVDLARHFGASACGEGVETLDEARCLAQLGFDMAQGYYFAKPMPCNEFLEFLSKRKQEPGWGLELSDQTRTAARA